MDPIKALQAVEEILFEVSLWVILAPRTLLKAFFSPQWIQQYIEKEWKKTESPEEDTTSENTKMFDEYMSPIFFFLIVGVLPLYLMLRTLYGNSSSPNYFILSWVAQQTVETSFTILGILFLTGPLAFSLGMQIARKAAFGRKSVKRIFYTQCYCFTPLYLFSCVAQIIYDLHSYSPGWIFLLPFVWFLLAEIFTFSQELDVGPLKAIGLTLLCFIGTVIFYVCGFYILVALVGLTTGRWIF